MAVVRATDATVACFVCGLWLTAPPDVVSRWAAGHWDPKVVALHVYDGPRLVASVTVGPGSSG